MAIFSAIQSRCAYLRGLSTWGTSSVDDTTINSHINASILDIVNFFPFSWDRTTANLTLTAGVSNLPTDYNPKWGLYDARIGDNIFRQIDPVDKAIYSATDYVYWITYDNSNKVYVFNTPTQTGTVAIIYYFIPTALSGSSDVCLVPDPEAVAYLASSKMWIGDERNEALKMDYEQESQQRIKSLIQADAMIAPQAYEGTVVDLNNDLWQ